MHLRNMSPGLNPWFWIPFFVGLFGMTFHYIGVDFGYLPGDLGDTRFNIFILEHARQFMGREVDAFWNAGFMYPEAEVISMSDNLLGSAPFYALFRWLGADIFTAFQWWIIILAFLNYWAAYKLAEVLLHDKRAAAIAAFIFAFSLSLASQMNHAQTFPRFAIPLAILFLIQWQKTLNTRDFVLAITFMVYQFYCGIYLGFMGLIPFIIIFLTGTWPRYREVGDRLRKPKVMAVYGATLIIHALLLLKLFMPYLRRAAHGGLHTFQDISHSIPSPFSYLAAHPASIFFPDMHHAVDGYTAFWDHWIFPGWITLAGFIVLCMLLLIKIMAPRHRFGNLIKQQQLTFFTAGIITMLIVLRVNDHSLYYLMHQIPGYGAMRALARIININLLFMGVAAACVISMLIQKKIKNPVAANLVYVLVITLLIAENLTSPAKIVRMSKAEVTERHLALTAKMNHLRPGSIISYEPDTIQSNVIFYQLDAMLAAQALHMKSVNGYSGTSAYMFDRYWMDPNPETRAYWFSRFPDLAEKEIYVIK